jgi:hypothetical protein
MRLNEDAFDDLVILSDGETKPAVVITVCAHPWFTVDSTGTERTATPPTTSVRSIPTPPHRSVSQAEGALMAAVPASECSSGPDCIQFAIPAVPRRFRPDTRSRIRVK